MTGLWPVPYHERVTLIPLLHVQIFHPAHLRLIHVAVVQLTNRNLVLHLVIEKLQRHFMLKQTVQPSKTLNF